MIPQEHLRFGTPNLWLTPECAMYATQDRRGFVGFLNDSVRYLVYPNRSPAPDPASDNDWDLLLAVRESKPQFLTTLQVRRCLESGCLFLDGPLGLRRVLLLPYERFALTRTGPAMMMYAATKTPTPWLPSWFDFWEEVEAESQTPS